ncbi:MAG TPA: GFA family protein, partial [Thermoanaerobaculia bacterium]|nr:GFA family protein [Thermoanaerobaculia bacterium]
CRQCARWTGYAVAATAVTPEHFHVIASADSLAWYRASEHASRGFCRACGSSLFWKPDDGSRISVLAGSLDPPTGLTVAAHIYVADKSDYVAIAEGAPCYEHESTAPLLPPARIGKT